MALFNGIDGEWTAEVAEAGKRGGQLACLGQAAPQLDPPDLWLMFAPIKKARTDFIVEKAAEMGAARILPVLTEFTNAERIRRDRLQAHAVEAAEQCGGTFVPQVDGTRRSSAALLADWPEERQILFCRRSARRAHRDIRPSSPATGHDGPNAPWAILIGPEGGFSEPERDAAPRDGQRPPGAPRPAHPARRHRRRRRADAVAIDPGGLVMLRAARAGDEPAIEAFLAAPRRDQHVPAREPRRPTGCSTARPRMAPPTGWRGADRDHGGLRAFQRRVRR